MKMRNHLDKESIEDILEISNKSSVPAFIVSDLIVYKKDHYITRDYNIGKDVYYGHYAQERRAINVVRKYLYKTRGIE